MKLQGLVRAALCSTKRTRHLACCSRLRFAQSHARATAVRVDERHAGPFEGTLDDLSGGAAGLTNASFELVDGHNPNPGALGQIVLGPSQ